VCVCVVLFIMDASCIFALVLFDLVLQY